MLNFQHVRTIAISGFVADADPNVSAPSAGNIFTLASEVPHPDVDGIPTTGFLLAPFFDVNEAATCAFTAWVCDSKSGRWLQITAESGAGHAALFSVRGPQSANVFIQVTAVSVIAAAHLDIMVAEGF